MWTHCVACRQIVVCPGAGGGALWRSWDNGGRHDWPVHVFWPALASFHLGTSCVRCPPAPYPTNNQPPIHPIISVNNRRMRTFQVAILCPWMVERHLCCMAAPFHHLGVGSTRWSSKNDGNTHYQNSRLAILANTSAIMIMANRVPNWSPWYSWL